MPSAAVLDLTPKKNNAVLRSAPATLNGANGRTAVPHVALDQGLTPVSATAEWPVLIASEPK